jgi:hypothetical protein
MYCCVDPTPSERAIRLGPKKKKFASPSCPYTPHSRQTQPLPQEILAPTGLCHVGRRADRHRSWTRRGGDPPRPLKPQGVAARYLAGIVWTRVQARRVQSHAGLGGPLPVDPTQNLLHARASQSPFIARLHSPASPSIAFGAVDGAGDESRRAHAGYS